MNPILALAKRNCLCFLRDRSSVFFSFMAAFIVIILYAVFLRDNLVSAYPDLPGMGSLVDVWVISGILSIVAVTASVGSLQIMVDDRATGREDDILVSPMDPRSVTAGYILSTFAVGMLMSLLVFAVALAYLAASGCPLDAVGILQAGLLLVPSVLSGSVIMFAVSVFFSSTGAFSGMYTVVSVLIGFVTGIYMPMGVMPDAVYSVSILCPATSMASLFRDSLAGSALDQALAGSDAATVAEFRRDMGFDLFFGDAQLGLVASLAYVAVVTVLFAVIAVYAVRRRSSR